MKASILHPWGEPQPTALTPWSGPVAVDTLGGRVPVEWDPQATVTPLGQLPFFTEFLLVSGRFEPWVADCPLRLASPHAPCRRNLLGTAILAILAGHQRYAPINGRRGDTLNPPLLGMTKGVSEDAVRGNFSKIDDAKGVLGMPQHLDAVTLPILSAPWMLDSDVTVKVLDGRQEGAVKGDNPHQPGRPSPTDPTDYIANLRRILDVAVPPGNPTASAPSAPGRWALLGRLPRAHGPVFMRGDRDGGTPANRARAAPEGVDYRFQWRLTPGVQTTLERLMRDAHWTAAGQGGQGAETRLRLTGWHRARRAIVLRRRVKADLAAVDAGHPGQ